MIIGSGGMQGRIVCKDLLRKGYSLFLTDLYRENSEQFLGPQFKTEFAHIDLRHYRSFLSVIRSCEAPTVINCAEENWNYDVYRACLLAGKNVMDLGSDIPDTKKQLALDDKFKKINKVAITGCGSTPGINNIMLRYAAGFFSSIHTIEAGFAWNSNKKIFVVPFSLESIIEELTESALYIENGKWKKIKPMDSVSRGKYRAIGYQSSFLVHHPETYTFYKTYKHMGLKNVKFYAGFPKHSLDVIKMLYNLGFGDKESIQIENIQSKPIDMTNRILKRLPNPSNYRETENLWVDITGKSKTGRVQKIFMECIIPTIKGWEDAGCNIDTGIPVSIIAEMINKKQIKQAGSFAPENVINPKEFFKLIRRFQMKVYKNEKLIN